MAQKLTASIPETLDLDSGYQILFTAVDASTGAAVTAVKISNASIICAPLGGTTVAQLTEEPTWLSIPVQGESGAG